MVNLDWADQIADEVSKVDREELLWWIEDENLFSASFSSDLSVSTPVK